MSDLVFYTHPMSRGRIVRWMLEELGEPYQTHYLDFKTTMKSPDYLSINPMGKVPAITHKGAVVTETAAICAYLADAFPSKRLAPAAGSADRAAYLRWMFFAAGPVEQVVLNQTLGLTVPEDKQATAGYGSRDRVMEALEPVFADAAPFLLGDQFTALDVYLGSQISWGVQFGALEPRPAFARYQARIEARPAAVRARKIDDDRLAQGASPSA